MEPTVTGPAVTLNTDALRVWLDAPSGTSVGPDFEFSNAELLGIDNASGQRGASLLNRLAELLPALSEDTTQTAWRLGEGVSRVGFFRTYDAADGPNGAVIHVDLANQVRLASTHQGFHDFAEPAAAGVDAAVQALSRVAREANVEYARYRQASGA